MATEGKVSALDALMVINRLPAAPADEGGDAFDFRLSGAEGDAAALDAVLVINFINRDGAAQDADAFAFTAAANDGAGEPIPILVCPSDPPKADGAGDVASVDETALIHDVPAGDAVDLF